RAGLAGRATLLSATMFIIIEVGIGMLAFWTTNTRNLFEVYDLFLYLASGELVPLALFPSWLHTALAGLPFRYTFSFPIEVFLGKLGAAGVAASFLWQAGWLLVLPAVARTLRVRALRRSTPTGMTSG